MNSISATDQEFDKEYAKHIKAEYSWLPIPLIPATQSEGFRPAVPIEGGHLFRSIPATPRSEATLVFDISLIRHFTSSFCFFRMDPPFNWIR